MARFIIECYRIDRGPLRDGRISAQQQESGGIHQLQKISISPRDSGFEAVFHRAMAFELHPRLAAGGFEIGTLGGCRVLLKNSALFPWIILVPEVEGAEDLHQLSPEAYHEVTQTIRKVSQFLADHFQPDKLNVASIGNQVRQMHIHIVGRSPSDPAWPGTVWAFDGKQPYQPDEAEKIVSAARVALGII